MTDKQAYYIGYTLLKRDHRDALRIADALMEAQVDAVTTRVLIDNLKDENYDYCLRLLTEAGVEAVLEDDRLEIITT